MNGYEKAVLHAVRTLLDFQSTDLISESYDRVALARELLGKLQGWKDDNAFRQMLYGGVGVGT